MPNQAGRSPAEGDDMSADVGLELTDFERTQIDAVRRWIHEESSRSDRLLARIGDGAEAALERVQASDRVAAAIQDAARRVMRGLDDQLRDLQEVVAVATPTTPLQRSEVLAHANERAHEVRRYHTRRLAAQSAAAGAASVNLVTAVLAVAAEVSMVVRGGLHAAAHILNVFGTPASHPSLLHASVEVATVAGITDSVRRRTTLAKVVRSLTGHDHREAAQTDLPRMVAQQTSMLTITETLEQLVRRAVQRRTLRVIPLLGGAASALTSWDAAGRICEAAAHAGRLTYLTHHTGVPPSNWFPPGNAT